MKDDPRKLGGTPNFPVRVDLPCAWYGAAVQDINDWVWHIRSEHVEELDAALRISKEKNIAEQEVTREDFPLDDFAVELRRMLYELEFGRGFVLMRGFPVQNYDYHDIRRIYWGIGQHIGIAESQNIKGELIQEIRDHGFDYTRSEHRGSMSAAELRPHCDITDVVGLVCLRTAKYGGKSFIRSSMTIYNEILEQHPEFLPVLHRGFHFELDGKGPTGDPNEVTHRIPIYSWHDGYIACRFNQKAIEAGALKVGSVLSELEQAAINFIGDTAVREDVELSMVFEPGDIQWLNNYVILHSRGGFEDYEELDRKRLLLRLWLNHPGAVPLADDFANKALTGPRKGVINRGATYKSEDLLQAV